MGMVMTTKKAAGTFVSMGKGVAEETHCAKAIEDSR